MGPRRPTLASTTSKVDTMGLLLKVLVTPANVTDRDGGAKLLAQARAELPSLRHLFVDGGYQGR